MRFPLDERVLNRGCADHIAAGLSCGADYRAHYVGLYAPFNGTIFFFNESGGGNWIRLTRADGTRVEFAHLSDRMMNGSNVFEGARIGTTGNTGTTTTGPHLHVQVFNSQGNRVDPEKFFTNLTPPPMFPEDKHFYQLIEGNGGFGLQLGGKFRVDDLDKLLATFIVNNSGDIKGRTGTCTLAQWNSISHWNLKGQQVP